MGTGAIHEIRNVNLIMNASSSEKPNDSKRPLDSSKSDINKSLFEPSTSNCNSDKRLKSNNSSQIRKRKFRSTDKSIRDVIKTWQLRNLTQCLCDNSLNILTSMVRSINPTLRETTFYLENEAVMMAIEEHGLRQQNSNFNCPFLRAGTDIIINNRSFSVSNKTDSSYDTNFDFCVQHVNRVPVHSVNNYFQNNEVTQEFNFENNFITTAVSAAIEEKGLSYVH